MTSVQLQGQITGTFKGGCLGFRGLGFRVIWGIIYIYSYGDNGKENGNY